MVVGGIIGSGIFLNPALVAERVRTAELTLLVWVLGGAIALIGALVFAELVLGGPLPEVATSICATPMASCRHFYMHGPCCWSLRPERSRLWR